MRERIFKIMGGPTTGQSAASMLNAGHSTMVIGIPWTLIAQHESQCLRNHSQTPQQLHNRGGLSSCEAVAVLEDRPWSPMDEVVAQDRLMEIVNDYTRTVQAAPSDREKRLVKDAYFEGFCAGESSTIGEPEEYWDKSEARAALADTTTDEVKP